MLAMLGVAIKGATICVGPIDIKSANHPTGWDYFPWLHRPPSLLRKKLWVAPAAMACHAAGNDLFWTVSLGKSAVTQLPKAVVAHGPQTAITLDKEAVIITSSTAVTLLATICVGSVRLL